ncbi:hypothetical protein D3C81_1073060 [compost metagenome]
MAGFLGQALGLVIGVLELVTCALELLLACFDTRQHGVERFRQATDLIVIAALGAQGIVFLAGDLA